MARSGIRFSASSRIERFAWRAKRKEEEGGMCRCSPGHSTGTCFLDRWSVQHMLSNCRSLSSVISMYAGIVRRFPRRGCRSLAAASISCGRFFSSLPPPPPSAVNNVSLILVLVLFAGCRGKKSCRRFSRKEKKEKREEQ